MDKEAIEFLVTAQKKREKLSSLMTSQVGAPFLTFRTIMMFVKVTCTPLSQLKMGKKFLIIGRKFLRISK